MMWSWTDKGTANTDTNMTTKRLRDPATSLEALYGSPFMREVITRYHPIGLRLAEKRESPIRLYSHELVTVNVFRGATRMLSSIERLLEVPFYITRFPNNSAFTKAGITRVKWIRYHYSMFTITAVTVADTSLLLSAEVFDLGLEPRDCSERSITKNRHIRGKSTEKALRELHKLAQPYRETRNAVVHHGEEADLGQIDLWEMLTWLETRNPGSRQPISKELREVLVRGERQKLAQTLHGQAHAFVDAAQTLFDALHDPFLEKARSVTEIFAATARNELQRRRAATT